MAKEFKPSKLCFVIGPIGGEESAERVHADWLLETIIEPVMAKSMPSGDLPCAVTPRGGAAGCEIHPQVAAGYAATAAAKPRRGAGGPQ